MTTSPDVPALSRLELLVLARLSGGRKPPSENEIAKDLMKLALPQATQAEAREQAATLLHRLQARGLIDSKRNLSEGGRSALRGALKAHKTPAWQEVRDRYLPAITLEVSSGSDTVAKGDALQAALLAPTLGVPNRGSVTKLLDDVVALELGLGSGPVTMERIRAHLLARRAGVEPRGKAREIVGRLAARRVRAPRGTLKDLRAALARSWATGDGIAPLPDPEVARAAAGTPPVPAAQPRSIDEASFAHLVEDAAHNVGPNGRFGSQKVFISAIWDELSRQLDISLDELKQRLLDANRQGFLSLARADLVGAMDPAIVARSEIADANASFHFVIDSGRR